MESIASQITNTILMRPYVFVFLFLYFVGCSMHLGIKRAALFSVIGYVIAWLSEYSSIHTGIPYGDYFYIEHTRGKEIWVLGVPFMDSISYVFLAYASYSMALVVLSPLLYSGKAMTYLLETNKIRKSLHTRMLASIFFVYLDIIIDPVALRGNKWFLGQIYGYPQEGVYFGVPVSNFLGWFVVGFIMIYSLQKIETILYNKNVRDLIGYKYPWRYSIGPLLYLSVLVFNLFMTFSIGEYTLGWVGVFLVLLPSVLFYFIIKTKLSTLDLEKAVREHLRDFPNAFIPPIEQLKR